MLDIKLIRENPEKINELLKRRNPELSVDKVLEIDVERRKIQTQADELRALRKAESQKIGEMKKKGENTDKIQEEVRELGDKIKAFEEQQTELDEKQRNLLLTIPNIPDENTPIGANDEANVVRKVVGEVKKPAFEQKAHWDLVTEKDIVDFERGVKISQSRFYIYKNKGARLERAIINFFLDLHTTEHGYEEILPPVLVNSMAMTGTGQLPKFEDDAYKVDKDTFLIPTAEVPVTNMYREMILDGAQLPIRHCAYSTCFRAEAGSAGRDTRGLIRQHQFNKVEMVKIAKPEQSYDELESMTAEAEKVLQMLGLPYRVVTLCTGDMGFSAAKTYDIEVWMPSYGRYVEISSCSNCEDFQARRAGIRYRENPKAKPQFAHTLNGSGVAVGRTVAAILENYQNEDGTVTVPEVLRPYMGTDIIK